MPIREFVRRLSKFFLVLIALAGLTLLLAFGIYTTLTSHVAGANDFLSRWAGARALFVRGENPYSDEVTREIQMQMYGRPAGPDEDQVAFAYPLYSAFVVAPLVGLPYAQAQALWMAFLMVGVVAAVILLARDYGLGGGLRPELNPLALGLLVVGALCFYPAVRGVFLGQFTLFVFLCLVLALAAIRAGRDVEAGVLLALATVKPQPALFLVPVLILWAARHRRWRIVQAAAFALALLVGIALLLVPTWLADFVDGVRKYAIYEPVGPPVQTLAEWLIPATWSTPVYLALSAALAVRMGWRVFKMLGSDWDEFQPTLGLVALVTVSIAGRVGTPDQMLVLITWFLWLGRWLRNGRWYFVPGGGLALIVAPWFVFIATLQGNTEHVGVTLVLPLLSWVVYVGSILVARLEARFFRRIEVRVEHHSTGLDAPRNDDSVIVDRRFM